MARFTAVKEVDMRTLDFGALIRLSHDYYIDDRPITLQGVTYDMAYILQSDQADTETFEFYGSGLTTSAGVPGFTGGRILAMYHWWLDPQEDAWFYDIDFVGFNISAKALTDAMSTLSPADDRRLIAQMLANNDTVTLGRYNDWFDGKAGNDTIRGNGGADTLHGDYGNDRIFGGNGRDLVQGDEGADLVTGGAGNDTLAGGSGIDTVSGGGGADTFVLWSGVGTEIVTDFENGLDHIQFITGPTRFSQLTITDIGADVRVSYGTMSLILKGIQPGVLNAADFLFG